MTEHVFFIMNIIGLIAFAITGAIKAVREELDLFGITVLGIMTALGEFCFVWGMACCYSS